MPAGAERLAEVVRILDGASLWGVELDTRYRVLAATFEPTAVRHPGGAVDDRRVQVLLSPVNRFAAVLRRQLTDGRVAIEQFDVAQLATVVEVGFAGTTPTVRIDDGSTPLESRFPQLSLHGESQALDGRAHTLSLTAVSADDELDLDLETTFDDAELRDAAGVDLPLASDGG